jgi:spore coat protein CotH
MKRVFTRNSITPIQAKISFVLIGLIITISSFAHAQAGEQADKKNLSYSKVFNQKKINRIDIIINKETWDIMQDGIQMINPPIPHDRPSNPPREPDSNHASIRMPYGSKANGQKPPMPPQGTPPTPNHNIKTEWHECTILFEGKVWNHVGIRYKGNSSLMSAASQENGKYSYKLDFDQFEKQYAETKNQRFYGFKQLNLINNFKDPSLMREKIASDLLREFGIPAAMTSFYVVYIDNGNGPQFAGIYTMVEEIDNTVIKTQFKSKKGNLYKPEGRAATFAFGTFNKDEMNLKSKKNKSTYEDVEKLYNILHSETRISNPVLWRTQLEEVFDVFTFLKWLASKNVIENWDSYGQSPRNYYLYNNPENKLLTWIPWDNNEALLSPHQNHNNPHMHGNDSWPLIDYILGDSFYSNVYNDNLSDFATYIFNIEKMQDLYSGYSNLLKPYIIEEAKQSTFIQNEEDFESAVEYLKKHVVKRHQIIEELLN